MGSTVFNQKSFSPAKSYFAALQLWCDWAAGCAWMTSIQSKTSLAVFCYCVNNYYFFFIVSVLLCAFCGEGITGGFRCGHKNTSTLSSLIFSIRHLVPDLIRNNRAVYRFLKITQLFFPLQNCQGNRVIWNLHVVISRARPPLCFFNPLLLWFIVKLQSAPSHCDAGQHSPTEKHRRRLSLQIVIRQC